MWLPDGFHSLHPPLYAGRQYRRADHVDIEGGAGGDHQLVACADGRRPPAVVRDVETGLATEQFQAAGVLAVAHPDFASCVEGNLRTILESNQPALAGDRAVYVATLCIPRVGADTAGNDHHEHGHRSQEPARPLDRKNTRLNSSN